MCASISFNIVHLKFGIRIYVILVFFFWLNSPKGKQLIKRMDRQKGLNIASKRKRSCGESFMTDLDLAVAPMHRLCKKVNAERVSEAAAKELAKVLDEIGCKIAKEALDFAMHAGRKTIKAEDIEIAAKKVMER